MDIIGSRSSFGVFAVLPLDLFSFSDSIIENYSSKLENSFILSLIITYWFFIFPFFRVTPIHVLSPLPFAQAVIGMSRIEPWSAICTPGSATGEGKPYFHIISPAFIIYFIIYNLYLGLGSHLSDAQGITPNCPFRNYSWWCSGYHMGCWVLKPGWLHAR